MIFGKMKSLLAVLALALLLAPAAQAAPAKLSSAWMGEHETFVAWYAKQQGWDKEAGLDLTMIRARTSSKALPPTIGQSPGAAPCPL